MDCSKLPRGKVFLSRAGLSFRLFYFSTNNTRESSKIPLPRHILLYNIHIYTHIKKYIIYNILKYIIYNI